MSTKRNVTLSLIVIVVATIGGTEIYDRGYFDGQRSVFVSTKSSIELDANRHIVEDLLRDELEDALQRLAECESRLNEIP